MDSTIERYAKIEKMVEEALQPYREIYEEKKKMENLNESRYVYQEKCSPSPTHPWASIYLP